MPYIPSIQRLQATTPNILNAIRNDLGGTYADLVPLCNNTNQSLRSIGSAIMENSMLQNSFLNALMNRIGMTIITSKSYSNPWKVFKKGMLEFGETIEEIYVNMAKPYQFDPDDAETTVFKQYKPDVSSAFHTMNFSKFYPQTITKQQLKTAFLNMSGLTDLISKITESMYTGMEYDEFIVMKYMLGRIVLAGKVKPINVPLISDSSIKDIVSTIKGTSNLLTYMSADYNIAGVTTHSPKGEQYVILTSTFESEMDVNVLASAFNMDKADFMGIRVGVDGFDKVDTARLAILFADDKNYVPFTTDELAELQALPAMIVDKDFFMIFDNLLEMSDVQNPKGLYWNYFLNVWKTFSVSPFANAVLFTTLTPAVTAVTVSPATATAGKGTRLALTATVTSTGFANNSVIWSVNSTDSTITPDGQLTVSATEAKATLTVTATSVFDGTKKATATITIA